MPLELRMMSAALQSRPSLLRVRSVLILCSTLGLMAALELAYAKGSITGLVIIVVSAIVFATVLDRARRFQNDIAKVILISLLAFAPPVAVQLSAVSLRGVNVLPCYLVAMLYPILCFSHFQKVSVRIVWPTIVLAVSLAFSGMLSIGESAFSAGPTLLILFLAFTLPFISFAVVSVMTARAAILVLSVILILQIYQAWSAYFNAGNDPLFWFSSYTWLRYGAGYTGGDFNPFRLYAFFWDPNYVIAVTLPLFLLAHNENGPKQQWYLEGLFLLITAGTLSFQSIVIAVIAVMGVRSTRANARLIRRCALVLAILVPWALLGVAALVPASALPPPLASSTNERLEVVWAVAQAVAHHPFGIGAGVFKNVPIGVFFPVFAPRTLPPHGWLFEVVVSGGFFGYYATLFALHRAIRVSSKLGNIAMAGFLFWGVTSPALGTPYLWIGLGMVMALSIRQGDGRRLSQSANSSVLRESFGQATPFESIDVRREGGVA